MDKRPTRWDLNRIIRDQKADIERLERQVMELVEELAKRDKIIATLRGQKNV
jgi:septal ring factor EnvC (AmiA/AmiB activator)